MSFGYFWHHLHCISLNQNFRQRNIILICLRSNRGLWDLVLLYSRLQIWPQLCESSSLCSPCSNWFSKKDLKVGFLKDNTAPGQTDRKLVRNVTSYDDKPELAQSGFSTLFSAYIIVDFLPTWTNLKWICQTTDDMGIKIKVATPHSTISIERQWSFVGTYSQPQKYSDQREFSY